MARKVSGTVRIKPKKMTGFREPGAKLVFGEIPRRITVRGKIWTWQAPVYMKSMQDLEKELRAKKYLTLFATIKGQRQLYFRRPSRS